MVHKRYITMLKEDQIYLEKYSQETGWSGEPVKRELKVENLRKNYLNLQKWKWPTHKSVVIQICLFFLHND